MKILKILLASMVMVGTGTFFLIAKSKSAHNIVSGTTQGKYKKPGAPVDMSYTVDCIQNGEVCSVDIRLITTEKHGIMQVDIKPDKALNLIKNISLKQIYKLDKNKGYPLHLDVEAKREGVYYIRILVDMKKKGFRAFVIPLKVGNGSIKLHRKPIGKNDHGENITVSSGIETIRKK